MKTPFLMMIEARAGSNARLKDYLRNWENSKRDLEIKMAGTECTIYIYDVISYFWGINPKEFVVEVENLDCDVIHVRVDSPGGDVFGARAMKTALEQHQARVIFHIDGLTASAATFLAMAGDEIEMTEGAFWFIHKAWTMMIGNAHELRTEADLLDKIDASIAADFIKKTGASAETIEQWLADETWFNAREALDAGFIDRIYEKDAAADDLIGDLIDDPGSENTPADPLKNENAAIEGRRRRAHAQRRMRLIQPR